MTKRAYLNIEESLCKFITYGGRYLVAVSGGKDSMCLLYALASIKEEHALGLEVAHVNYSLRKKSIEEAQFVEKECKKLHLPFHLLNAPQKPAKTNMERWAREIRYPFFYELLQQKGLDITLTAHTANDMSETLLMKLLSNKELKNISLFDEKRRLLRPFLYVSLKNIQEYLQTNNISWIEDSSNTDTSFLRNRVRHELIPHLEQHFEPNIIDILSDQAQAIEGDIDCIYNIAQLELQKLNAYEWGSEEWTKQLKKYLFQASPSISWRLLSLALKQQIGYLPGKRHSERAIEVVIGQSLACELPSHWKMRRKKGGIISVICDH